MLFHAIEPLALYALCVVTAPFAGLLWLACACCGVSLDTLTVSALDAPVDRGMVDALVLESHRRQRVTSHWQ